ncbi:hypothetical protein ACVWZX_005224, partial [Deinococcus sp. UYEF24]
MVQPRRKNVLDNGASQQLFVHQRDLMVLAPFWCTWLSREHADSQQIEVGAAIHLPLD